MMRRPVLVENHRTVLLAAEQRKLRRSLVALGVAVGLILGEVAWWLWAHGLI
jgi:hypothetical protein